MGMFDYIRCKYPLPLAGANELRFQSKDTPAQFLDEYEIREDGSLWHEDYETEDRSYPNAEGLLALIGIMTRVNCRWEPCTFTGDITFGMYIDEELPSKTWVEYSAYFLKGQLRELHQLEP